MTRKTSKKHPNILLFQQFIKAYNDNQIILRFDMPQECYNQFSDKQSFLYHMQAFCLRYLSIASCPTKTVNRSVYIHPDVPKLLPLNNQRHEPNATIHISELNIGSSILPGTNHHEPLGERMRFMKVRSKNMHSSFPCEPSIKGIVPTNPDLCITSSCFGSVRRFCVSL